MPESEPEPPLCPQRCSHRYAECPQCGDRSGPRIKGRLYDSTPVLCDHANECPAVCPCPEHCYCKLRTCDRYPQQNLRREVVSPETLETHRQVIQAGGEPTPELRELMQRFYRAPRVYRLDEE